MEAFKKILKSSALVVGSFFLLRVVAAVEPNTSLFLSGIVLLLAAVAFFNPMPQYWIYGRATSVALLVTAMISLAFSGSKLNEERNATLLALRSQNPKHTWKELGQRGLTNFLLPRLGSSSRPRTHRLT